MKLAGAAMVVSFVSLAATGSAAVEAPAPPGWLVERAERLFLRTHARPSGTCPSGLDRAGDAALAVCASYDQGFERLRKTLEQYDEKLNETVKLPGGRHSKIFDFHRDWQELDALRVREWLEDDELVVLAFDESAGRLAVLPKSSCLDLAVRARPGLYDERTPGLAPAEVLQAPLPPASRPAPNGIRRDSDAVVQLVVTREGRVAGACVLHDRSDGHGRAARRAVERWQFAPATLDGEPVDSIVAIHFRWRQDGCSYERGGTSIRY